MRIAKMILPLLLIAQLSYGQFSLSPKVGLNVSSLNTEITSDEATDGRVGWHVGTDFRFRNGAFLVQPGVYYQSMTAELIRDVPNTPFETLKEKTTIQSARLPLNLGAFLTGEGGIINIHVRGGVVPTFILGINEKDNFSISKDDLSPFSLGANAAVGIDILFLTVDLGYEWGLTDFFENVDGKNNMLTLSAGLVF
ncbi:MAG: PorT family protein [Saprospiraceae bacterium]|nr:PorT family protein [Saprospiraceae bacterium]